MQNPVRTRTPQPSFNGGGFILHLILCSLLVVGGFISLLWLGFILSFGHMSDDLRRSATSHLEAYLSGQTPIVDSVSGQPDFRFTPYEDIEMINVIFEPDYWATLLEPCRTVYCSVKDKIFSVSVAYEVNGELLRERFVMVWNPSSYYWTIKEVDE